MKGYNEEDYGLGVFPDYDEPKIDFLPSYKRVSNDEENKKSLEAKLPLEISCQSEVVGS
jgi:hypothetical protein